MGGGCAGDSFRKEAGGGGVLIKERNVSFWQYICRYSSPLISWSASHTQIGDFGFCLVVSKNNPGLSVLIGIFIFFSKHDCLSWIELGFPRTKTNKIQAEITGVQIQGAQTWTWVKLTMVITFKWNTSANTGSNTGCHQFQEEKQHNCSQLSNTVVKSNSFSWCTFLYYTVLTCLRTPIYGPLPSSCH